MTMKNHIQCMDSIGGFGNQGLTVIVVSLKEMNALMSVYSGCVSGLVSYSGLRHDDLMIKHTLIRVCV